MIRSFGGLELGAALQREGLLPPECASVELHMPVDGLVQLQYVVNVRPEDAPKLARAIASLAPAEDDPLRVACKALLDAPHHDHFASRLGDEELAAVDSIKSIIYPEGADEDDYDPTVRDA